MELTTLSMYVTLALLTVLTSSVSLSGTPPSLSEVSSNLTLYLATLHSRLNDVAGPKADPYVVWETFLDVTSSVMIQWDDKLRQTRSFHPARRDGSIFVSLGSYRDPFCPMTLKSIYKQSKYPEKVFVGLFQQNCFKDCRTGVLAGGVVEVTNYAA